MVFSFSSFRVTRKHLSGIVLPLARRREDLTCVVSKDQREAGSGDLTFCSDGPPRCHV